MKQANDQRWVSDTTQFPISLPHTIRELITVYAIAARISRAVLESDGVAVCCIDSALK